MSVIQDNSITSNNIQPASGQALTIKDEGGTASITVQTDGDLTLAENAYLGSGKGIYFDGQTGSANQLSDYEEGTWTPTNAGDSTGTLTNPSGLYVKIGRTVIVAGVGVVGTSFTGTKIGGLPFAPSAYGSYSDKSRALVGNSRAINLNSSNSDIEFTDVNGANASVTSFRFTITYITD